MNICFPSLSYPLNGEPTSGVGSQVRLLAHALIDAGNSISVIDLARDDSITTVDERGAQVHRITCGKFHWFAGKLPVLGKLLASPLRELEYSIAVWRGVRKANKTRKLELIEGTETGMLLLALFWKQTPVIIRLHGEQYTFRKYTPGLGPTAGVQLCRVLQRVALRRAKLLISPSYAHAREIHGELGAKHPPIAVVPNSLAIDEIQRNGERTRASKTILYVGRIEQLKGIETLLCAAAQTRNEMPDARFVFAGNFESSLSKAEFLSLVHANGLDSNIELLGPVGWNVLSDCYQRSALAVLPSYYETFGLAALEPMAFGTPVLASDAGGLSEVVVPEVTGKLVTAGDSRALAEAMIELLSNPNVTDKMGRAAMQHAAQFDIRKMLRLNEQLYRWADEESWRERNPHIFFSPHLDDAVLSCGGLAHALLSTQKSVQVITVFAGDAEVEQSAFGRHLHAKWGTSAHALRQRRREDRRALEKLEVKEFQHWNYVEAQGRLGRDGSHLYATYEELRGRLADSDRELISILTDKILASDGVLLESAVLYFPLGLGGHVDHQILFQVGLRLMSAGKQVRFYEDYPYAEGYDRNHHELNWLPHTVAIDLQSKLRAASAYTTQIRGLGGSLRNLEKRLRAFGSHGQSRSTSERYWEVIRPVAARESGKAARIGCPLEIRQRTPRLRDFKKFMDTFRWHDLAEVLPIGSGDCLDLGCGPGRHRSLIEKSGYHWLGLDRASTGALDIQCDAAVLPVRSQSKAAVIAWQVLEYVERPEEVVAEAARVLEPGGAFCGSVSFLEPMHGRTFYNLSPLILEKLLAEHDFADIQIAAGLNGFSLLLWTWLRRSGIPFADRLAIPVTFALFVPLSALAFCGSWLLWQFGIGTGHMMRWLSQTAPQEFAGHVMFFARKKARPENCTSLS